MNWRILAAPSLFAVGLLAACSGGAETVTVGAENPAIEPSVADGPLTPPEPRVADDPPVIVVPDQDGPVLVLVESGGCFQAGPLCRTLAFYDDGRATVDWPDEADQDQQSYDLDPALIERWIDVVVSTNLDALVATLPEGSCQGCVDGVDLVMTVDVNGVTTTLDSMDVEFIGSEPLFSEAFAIVGAVPWEPPASVTEGY